ncbi:hypothetical protein [Flagellimonas marinaquae]|uniref:hypothetical protein n=1 Tax=Flagellimonas marinaquae TaxID=254955 RepID=UPI001F499F17|nr:hypothetical protein [Allomuricauda aquimarina]
MNKVVHNAYLGAMVVITVAITCYLACTGYTYYALPLEERFYHPRHHWFKPSGIHGQGLGVIGTFLIAFGVFIYIARKRYNFLERFIRLKYLLEFHIFLCTVGPIMILFHTAFKFGGIVSIAFWSMVAVVLSGILGRFIYNQIPRTIEGRALSLAELQAMKTDMAAVLEQQFEMDKADIDQVTLMLQFGGNGQKRQGISQVKKTLANMDLAKSHQKEILSMAKRELRLSKRISRLETMQRLFKYWHVVHMPFAIIMLVIVIIHVSVAWAMGYKWIF